MACLSGVGREAGALLLKELRITGIPHSGTTGPELCLRP